MGIWTKQTCCTHFIAFGCFRSDPPQSSLQINIPILHKWNINGYKWDGSIVSEWSKRESPSWSHCPLVVQNVAVIIIHILLSYNFCQILNSHLVLQQYIGSLSMRPTPLSPSLGFTWVCRITGCFLGNLCNQETKENESVSHKTFCNSTI